MPIKAQAAKHTTTATSIEFKHGPSESQKTFNRSSTESNICVRFFQITPPAPVVDYIPDAAAVAAAYTNLNPMYAASPYPSSTDNLYMTPSVHSSNFYPVTENLYHQYRLQGVSGYYPGEYHHSSVPTSYVANGFLPYDGYGISTKSEEKWQDGGKYYSGHDVTSRSMYSEYSSPTGHSQV